MPVNADTIKQARDAGYTDSQIRDYIVKSPEYGQARKAGYSDGQIFSHLGFKDVSQPTTSRKELQPEIDKMGGVKRFLTGVGGGMYDAYKGVEQAGATLGNKLGLVSDRTVNRITQEGQEARNQLATLTDQSGAASAGRFVGKVAPFMAVPGGVGGGVARNMLTGALTGGAMGATEFVPKGESRGRNALIGAATGGSLPAVGAALKPAAKAFGSVAKPMLGKLTGAGAGAVDEAIQAGTRAKAPWSTDTAFTKAMRGKIDPDRVVGVAHDALRTIKDNRAADYVGKLAEIKANDAPIDTTPIRQKLISMMEQYGVKIKDDGSVDYSRIAMGRAGRKDIREVVNTISSWGQKEGDNTAVGLDTLKRQLDDFYSDSSQARQFVSSIRDTVKQTLVNNVPEYEAMTKNYAESTRLIKDIESGLMMRKTGISGRIVADQTLRRLNSAMKENFVLRKELTDALGLHGGKDVSGTVAGYTMSTAIPRGLSGTGMALVGEALLVKLVNPHLWPMFAASSPRIVGEFLHTAGYSAKVSRQLAAAIPATVNRLGTKGVQRVITEYAASSPQPAQESLNAEVP